MKIYTLIILLFLSAPSCFAQRNNKDILDASYKGFAGYLEKIPAGQEPFYGFQNRNEFALAIIGKPYQILTLAEDFFSDTLLSDKNYLKATGEWRVCITVNGENRILLTVAKMDGVWQVVGIGAAVLAKQLGDYEKKYSSPDQDGMILRVYQLDSDFFLSSLDKSSNELKVFPLISAKMAFNKTSDSSSYSLSEALTLIKMKLNK